MLLDESYFIGPLTIAQLGQKAVSDSLTVFINRFEPKVLQAALGYDLYQAFIDGLDVGSGEEIEQKWIDLRDGKWFDNAAGAKRQWKGFANSSTKESVLAYFIFAEYMRNLATQVTGVGVVKSNAENSIVLSPDVKMSEAHNHGCREMLVLREFLSANTDVYTEYDPSQVYNSTYGYGYGSNQYSFRSINQFGI